jgi:hypothetical protein
MNKMDKGEKRMKKGGENDRKEEGQERGSTQRVN